MPGRQAQRKTPVARRALHSPAPHPSAVATAATNCLLPPSYHPPPPLPHRDYPQLPPEGGKPLERLVGAANRLGLLLTGEQQETLMEVRLAAGLKGSSCWRAWQRLSARVPLRPRLAQARPRALPNRPPAALSLPPMAQELGKATTKTSMLLAPLARQA